MRADIVNRVVDGATVLKDAEFVSLCNITTETDIPCISFVINEKFVKRAVSKENIAALIVPYSLKDNTDLLKSGKGIILAEKPKYAFHKLHNYLIESGDADYVNMTQDSQIGQNCRIHPSAVIAEKGVKLGNNVVIQENVIIREGVEIGDNVRIMPGAIIGSDACLAGRDADNNLMPLISAGRVKIGNNVQVGSYAMICKGLFPYECTEVGDYSLLGYAVEVSHNVHVGKNIIILDQSQVCGNTVVEEDAHLAPQVIVSNRLRIGKAADIAIGSVVVNNIKKNQRVAGNYAIENSKFLLWHRNKLKVKSGPQA